ncbi:hypothetical protein Bca4012_059252 [Brassica carinata]
MSLSLLCRYAFFSGATPLRISRSNNLCFALAAARASHRNTKLFTQPILLRLVSSPGSNLETVRDCRAHASSIGSYEDSSSSADQEAASSNGFDLNSLVSFAEVLCIVSSAVISVVLAVNYVVVGEIGRKVLSLGFVGLLGSVASGSWLRRRQCMRICKGEGTNLIRRLEKLEEDLKTSTTIVRVLSRHLEKLGIRFRVTRKALKEPISETAALAQKNSEATGVLAAQQEILEKELGEIQKVLLAMQDQQRKQLELILTIAKNGKLFENTSSKQASA